MSQRLMVMVADFICQIFIYSHNNATKKGAERSAINAPQGTAIDSWLQKKVVPLVHMIMQVHMERCTITSLGENWDLAQMSSMSR